MCTYGRALHEFPSRKYAYAWDRQANFSSPPEQQLQAGQVFRFIAGRDEQPVLIAADDGRRILHDPFAQLILFVDKQLPVSLRTLLATIDRFNSDGATGLPWQRSFVVADGGQIPWTPDTDNLQRDFRFVVVRQQKTSLPDLLISSSTNIDSESGFLQVIGWDPVAGAYQFYDRRNGAWVWAGSSWDSLAPDSRGFGPFDSHVNGALNMKELKQPWINWHSQAAAILESALAPSDPLRKEQLWTTRQPAQNFETDVARPGIVRWTNARFENSVKNKELLHLPQFMRQVLETTTVNLASSPVANLSLGMTQFVPLPLTFFYASDALNDILELEPNITIPQVKAEIYSEMLRRYEVRVGDGTHTFSGDTHFVFVVPEMAFEDLAVLQKLLSLGVLSVKLAAAILMIDFVNPVFSNQRAGLMRYVPESARAQGGTDLNDKFVAAIRQSVAASVTGSPEQQFIANWSLPEDSWKHEFEHRIESFFGELSSRLASIDDFARIFELAESRRREFRRRPLAEFRLTTPITNIPDSAPLLEFTLDGHVREKS